MTFDLSTVTPENGFAGNVTPEEAWAVLSQDETAALIDVRTVSEWTFVGVPDVSGLGKRLLTVEWSQFPSNQPNTAFAEQVREGLSQTGYTGGPVFMLCRSGARSRGAALTMTAEGIGPCYNILSGFEGDPDGAQHRGTVNGWKVSGLPWRQG